MDSLFVITGSSKGIGLALAKQLLENPSHQIIGIARSESPLTNEQYHHFRVDLSDIPTLISRLSDFFPDRAFQRIVLINNAGWIGEINHLGQIDPENIAKLYAINVTAPAILSNAFVKAYQNSQAIKLIINISSGAAKKGLDGWSGYSSSKAAINLFTEAAQNESNINKNGIRHFAVAPGVVDTAMQSDIRSANFDSFSSLEKFQNLYTSNQLSSPEESAAKIIYLIDHFEKFEGVLQDVRNF